MSTSRLLRAERLAERAAEVKEIRLHNKAVMRAREERVRSLPPPPPLPTFEPPPDAAPPADQVEAPPPLPETPPEPPQWWEERCRWRQRTAADDCDYVEQGDELDDPLGIYS